MRTLSMHRRHPTREQRAVSQKSSTALWIASSGESAAMSKYVKEYSEGASGVRRWNSGSV